MKKMVKISLALASLLILFLILSYSSFNLTGLNSKDIVFIDIHLEPEYSQSDEGDAIILGVRLVNLQYKEGMKDVTIKVFIANNESRIFLVSQTISLGESAASILSFSIPSELQKAPYHEIIVDVEDTNTRELLGSSTQRILIIDEDGVYLKLNGNSLLFIKIILGVISILLIIIFFIVKYNKVKYS